MARRRKRKEEGELRLSSKKHPPRGIASTILAVFSLLLFGSVCVYSGTVYGKAGMWIGAVGLLSAVISLVGFVLAWLSLHEDDVKTLFPTIGALFNSLLIILYMLLYLFGSVA